MNAGYYALDDDSDTRVPFCHGTHQASATERPPPVETKEMAVCVFSPARAVKTSCFLLADCNGGKDPMKTDVLVVGGGLAGLYLSYQLEQAGIGFLVVEARDRLGGRVLSLPSSGHRARADRYDLGPAWFWHGQPRLMALVNELGLNVFAQYSDGNLVFQDRDGRVQRDLHYSTTAGSLRISGGVACLIEKLSQRIPAAKVLCEEKVTTLSLSSGGIRATIQHDDGQAEISSSMVALALPPRLAARSIAFQPPLERDAITAMASIPTWMAAHAKVIAIYDRPFWRDDGLSGDGISQRGPLVQIHDASPATGATGALFGFVGVPAAVRRSGDFDLRRLAVEQLVTMYGSNAAQPVDVLVKDWAREVFTATADDENEQLLEHPPYGTPASLANLWDGKLRLASTEIAPSFGGYLEGALEAAELAAATIAARLRA
jgi:monoamine oxidase